MTLVEKATQQIKDMIVDRKYNDEGYLPSEGEMSTMFGVSRATIREAVRSMEVRGFVQRIHGKGVKVVENGADSLTQSMADMLDMGGCTRENIIEVRHIIETAAAKRAAFRASKEDILGMSDAVTRMMLAEKMDEDYIKADLDFHMLLVKASGNPVLSAIFSAYSPLLYNTIEAASTGEGVIEQQFHYHQDILTAIINHDKQAAGDAIRRHLRATEENVHVSVTDEKEE